MSASVACAPTSPIHANSEAVITVAGQASNDSGAYDATKYPTEPEIRCYVKATAGTDSAGAYTLKTLPFSTDSAGGRVLLPWAFPIADTWTVTLNKVSDDSQLATATVTVS